MGIFGFLAHRSSKSNIKKNIAWYERQSPDQRAGAIFYIWLLRGLNLAELSDSSVNLPIYYYLKGAESALTDVISSFENKVLRRFL
jgi:hypothetical protein